MEKTFGRRIRPGECLPALRWSQKYLAIVWRSQETTMQLFCSGPLENLGIVHAQGQVWPIANPEHKERLRAWRRVVSLNCLPEWTARVFVKKERGGPVHCADFGAIALRRFLNSERLGPSGAAARCSSISA